MDHFKDQVFSFAKYFIAVVIILSDVYIAVSQSLALLAYSHSCVTLLSSLENKFGVRKMFI